MTDNPFVFIGSSSEGLNYAEAIQATLEYKFEENTAGNLEIFNAIGQLIFIHNLSTNEGSLQFSTKDFQQGIYYCHISNNGMVIDNLKLIIIR